jgi:hypothetical protein
MVAASAEGAGLVAVARPRNWQKCWHSGQGRDVARRVAFVCRAQGMQGAPITKGPDLALPGSPLIMPGGAGPCIREGTAPWGCLMVWGAGVPQGALPGPTGPGEGGLLRQQEQLGHLGVWAISQ